MGVSFRQRLRPHLHGSRVVGQREHPGGDVGHERRVVAQQHAVAEGVPRLLDTPVRGPAGEREVPGADGGEHPRPEAVRAGHGGRGGQGPAVVRGAEGDRVQLERGQGVAPVHQLRRQLHPGPLRDGDRLVRRPGEQEHPGEDLGDAGAGLGIGGDLVRRREMDRRLLGLVRERLRQAQPRHERRLAVRRRGFGEGTAQVRHGNVGRAAASNTLFCHAASTSRLRIAIPR